MRVRFVQASCNKANCLFENVKMLKTELDIKISLCNLRLRVLVKLFSALVHVLVILRMMECNKKWLAAA